MRSGKFDCGVIVGLECGVCNESASGSGKWTYPARIRRCGLCKYELICLPDVARSVDLKVKVEGHRRSIAGAYEVVEVE